MSGGNTQLAQESPALEEMLTSAELLSINILGVQFAVRWGREVTLKQRESMRSAWARCATREEPWAPPLPDEPTVNQPYSASVVSPMHDGGTFLLQAASFEELAENLTSRLTVAAILANAGKFTMLHACGVADPDTGAVVALVAKSGTGKTTAASLLAQTYGYVTDETVAIRPDGSVIPYPKPLSVKQGPGKPKRQVGPDRLGLQPAPAKPFIQSIVLLDRVETKTNPTLTKVPLADAVLALIPDSSSQGAIGEPLQSLCRLIDSVGGVWQVTYSEAADLPAALAPLFRNQQRSKPDWVAAETDAEPGPTLENHVRRAAAKDAVAIDGDLLVMLEAEIVRLSGIGPAIWDATARPVTQKELTEEIATVHGRPEGYRAAVVKATEQLVGKEVLKEGGR